MPHQNRVTPFGEIVAQPARGTLMGNRGILHDAAGRLGVARWRHPHWVTCELRWKGWHREVLTPGRYTELFFLDEAVALAAGHRPCALCRRADYNAYRAAWAEAVGGLMPSAPEMDKALHPARVHSYRRRQVRHEAAIDGLPDGVFIALAEAPDTAWLIRGAVILPYCDGIYGPARQRPSGRATVLTPAPTVALLGAGYRPRLHDSAAVPLRD